MAWTSAIIRLCARPWNTTIERFFSAACMWTVAQLTENVCQIGIQIPPGIQVWLVFPLLTNFLCLSVTLSPSNVHTLTHSIIRTSLSNLPLLDLASHPSLCAICHTVFPRMLCLRHLACINSGLRSLAEKRTSVMHFAPLECEEGRRGEERFIWFEVLLGELLSLNH